MDLACPSGKVVEMHVSTCAATFGPQSGLKTLELANGTGDFTVKANVSGIAYTVTNDGFACSFNSTGAKPEQPTNRPTPSQSNRPVALRSTSADSQAPLGRDSPGPGQVQGPGSSQFGLNETVH